MHLCVLRPDLLEKVLRQLKKAVIDMIEVHRGIGCSLFETGDLTNMALAVNRCGDTIHPAGDGPSGIEVTQVLVIEQRTGNPFLGQLKQHLVRRFPLVDVHFLELPFDLIVFSICLIGPPEDRTTPLPSERFIEMIIHIGRFDKGEIKNSVTAVTAVGLARYTVVMAFPDC